jgi:hypothetical protein
VLKPLVAVELAAQLAVQLRPRGAATPSERKTQSSNGIEKKKRIRSGQPRQKYHLRSATTSFSRSDPFQASAMTPKQKRNEPSLVQYDRYWMCWVDSTILNSKIAISAERPAFD